MKIKLMLNPGLVGMVAFITLSFCVNAAGDWPLSGEWTDLGPHVALTGSDTTGTGSVLQPYRTIRHALTLALPGDTVFVHEGTYSERYIVLKDNVRLLSADGYLAARIYSGPSSSAAIVFTGNITNAEVDGFEIYADHNGGSGDGNGLVFIYNTSNSVLRNCLIHDAPRDADVIKITGYVNDFLMENLVIYNPAYRTKSEQYQENIDIFGYASRIAGERPVRNIVIRDSWLFHTEPAIATDRYTGGGDMLLYAKGDVENIVYENNIFGPSFGGWPGDEDGEGVAVLVGVNMTNPNDSGDFENLHAIVRNNIFVGCQGDGALSISKADDVWIYNNTFYNNSSPKLRSLIQLWSSSVPQGRVNIFNNIFRNNFPARDGNLARFIRVRNLGMPSELFHENNLYYNNLVDTDIAYTGKASCIYSDPLLTAPVVPSITSPTLSRIAEIREGFRVLQQSPAIDAGLDAVGRTGHPNWQPGVTDVRADIAGDSRPTAADTWDLGAFETPYSIIIGDVNDDKDVTMADAILVAKAVVGLPVTLANPGAADVDKSGTVTLKDALLIAQKANGVITEFPE